MTMMIERHETKASRPMSERIAALERMTASQLRREYAEVFGEESRSGNRQWLFRRIAWRIQFDAGGSFAQRADEKARALAKVHAADADIRSGPPKAPISSRWTGTAAALTRAGAGRARGTAARGP